MTDLDRRFNVGVVLTYTDITQINKLLDEKFEEQLRNMPSKDEFFGWMDKLMFELKAIRESQELLTEKVYEDHEERIGALEEKAGL